MCYFTLVTISTVGYGDFSPSTVLSRAFAVAAIFAGVTFFSYLSVRMLALLEKEASGRGKFRPQKPRRDIMTSLLPSWLVSLGEAAAAEDDVEKDRGHILLIGGGVTSGSGTVLETFLRALCRDGKSPEIVLMSQVSRTQQTTKVSKHQ
jgi:hypothetical protein